MRGRRVLCPDCGTVLELPEGLSKPVVRCGKCHHRFRLPDEATVTDEVIADWLAQSQADEWEEAEPPMREQQRADHIPVSGQTMVLPAIGGSLRLAKIDDDGATLQFPAKRLRELTFRAAMPRRCVRCGTKSHLRARVIVFAPPAGGTRVSNALRQAGLLELDEPGIQNLSAAELMTRLPHVPEVPPPADLPMPYWICDMCSEGDIVSGSIKPGSSIDRSTCRLFIGNVARAAEFMVAAGAGGSPDLMRLRRHISIRDENPWQALPTSVRNRIQQWFKPKGDEKFVAYFPDRDRTRTEDGTSGLVLSSRRLIYHRQPRHYETDVAETVVLKLKMDRKKGQVEITSPSMKAQLTVDRDGLRHLRHTLARAKFHATWR